MSRCTEVVYEPYKARTKEAKESPCSNYRTQQGGGLNTHRKRGRKKKIKKRREKRKKEEKKRQKYEKSTGR